MWSPSPLFLLKHMQVIVYSIYGRRIGLPEISGRPISPIRLVTGRTTSAKERYGALWSFRRAESTCRYVLDTSYGRYIITMDRNVNYFFACPKKTRPDSLGVFFGVSKGLSTPYSHVVQVFLDHRRYD